MTTYTSSDIARCRQIFAACCVKNGKRLDEIQSVGAGAGLVMVWFARQELQKPAVIPSDQPLDDIFIWEEAVRPDILKGRRPAP